MTSCTSQHQSSNAFLVSCVYICSMLQQSNTYVYFTLSSTNEDEKVRHHFHLQPLVLMIKSRKYKGYKICTLIAASCKGVKFQLSLVFGLAPASNNNLTTSQCPKEQALCNGCRPPSSRAWIDAPADRRNSTTSFLPYPIK